ncbi:39S ribosomal protein L51, mitochondrial isoform X1 [Arapaima gigas]
MPVVLFFNSFPEEGMSVVGSVLRAGASLCQSVLCRWPVRPFSTGVCSRIRMHAIPQRKTVDRWTEKRSMFGVYDNIGILGDFKAHPRDLIVGPVWLRGFRGNEFQRLTRKKRMVGDRMMATDRHNLEKRIRFLYRRFNRYGKHR